jgi:CheY-like chemotaxis protein
MGQYTGLEQKRILVVEDVEINQFLARHIMESWGCVVQVVENGALAVESIINGDFDLVLMDIQMPVMDGIQATLQIREMKDGRKSSIPIVALTANALRGDFDTYLRAGMNDCLPKPFEEPALFKIVYKNIQKNKENPMNVLPEIILPEVPAGISKRYDLSMVEAISGGDKDFIVKMLCLFLETVPPSLREMHSYTDKREWLKVSKVAHKLKSTIDSMGINELMQTIREVESNGKTGVNTGALPSLVGAITDVMNQVMAEVKKDYSL